MPKAPVAKKLTFVPSASSAEVRERWLELLGLTYATRRVTHQQVEPGVHVVVVPPSYQQEKRKEMLEADVRAAMRQVPELARGVRIALEDIDKFGLALDGDYRQWMGDFSADVAAGHTRAVVFIDLAYLETALLGRLRTAEVLVDFQSPLAFFRRGVLRDYANVLEAVAAMVFGGRSLAETADRVGRAVLTHLQLYANSFLKLSTLYSECAWRIERDMFVMEVGMPGKSVSLGLPYWDLRGGAEAAPQTLEAWRGRIETLLCEVAPYALREFPKSFAA
jgi:hypothetical protein